MKEIMVSAFIIVPDDLTGSYRIQVEAYDILRSLPGVSDIMIGGTPWSDSMIGGGSWVDGDNEEDT